MKCLPLYKVSNDKYLFYASIDGWSILKHELTKLKRSTSTIHDIDMLSGEYSEDELTNIFNELVRDVTDLARCYYVDTDDELISFT